MKTLDESEFLIPGFKAFVTHERTYVEAPEGFANNLFQDIKVVPRRRKIAVKYVPSELKARYGYRASGGGRPLLFGLQFDPFEEADRE